MVSTYASSNSNRAPNANSRTRSVPSDSQVVTKISRFKLPQYICMNRMAFPPHPLSAPIFSDPTIES